MGDDSWKSVVKNIFDCGEINLELASQKVNIKINIWLALIVVTVVIGFVKIANSDAAKEVLNIATHTYVNGKYQSTPSGVGAIYEFWTPSLKTYESIDDNEKKNLTDEKTIWYQIVALKEESEGRNILKEFGNKLKNNGAQGYSRFESYGRGKGPLKHGWTWRVTALKGSDLSKEKLLEIYKEFFMRDRDIYIEEIRVGDTLFDAH